MGNFELLDNLFQIAVLLCACCAAAPVKPENEIKVTPRNDKNRTARAQIILTPELKQRAVKVAQHTGVSFNELVNQLLEQYCAVVENNQD